MVQKLPDPNVCGCRAFWGLNGDSYESDYHPFHFLNPNQHMEKNLPAASCDLPETFDTGSATVPSTTLPRPENNEVKKTCFFWYHGNCSRKNDCNFAHEVRITWPIPPPPGYTHHTPCYLPLCPLRADLLGLLQKLEREERNIREACAKAKLNPVHGKIESDLKRIEKEIYGEAGTQEEDDSKLDNDNHEGGAAKSLKRASSPIISKNLAVASPLASPVQDEMPPLASIRHLSIQSKKRKWDDKSQTRNQTKNAQARKVPWLVLSPRNYTPQPKQAIRRALVEKPTTSRQICFSWYHLGKCQYTPRGLLGCLKCPCVHFMEFGLPVHQPENTDDHDPMCKLPYCPISGVKKVMKIEPLIDYMLPEGDDRANWDTDDLRRAFGEMV